MTNQRECDFISLAPYEPKTAFPRALELMAAAAGGEREDELFYDYLLGQAPRPEDTEVITSIRNDERKHNRLFRQIYCQITGQEIPPGGEGQFERPANYCDGIRRALFGELAAVERYRMILFGVSYNPVFVNVLTEIYTDELKHATKWNYLYCINDCCERQD